jgi:hypothetical protein
MFLGGAKRHLAGSLASRVPMLSCAGMMITIALLAIGCADTPSAATTQPRSSLMNDPMNYRPSADDYPDISGGGIGHFDKKGFKKDLDSVFNP